MNRHDVVTVVSGLVVLLAASAVPADDRPRFRGPNGSGAAPDTGLPVEISAATAAWTVAS
jgi:hypothetical protein